MTAGVDTRVALLVVALAGTWVVTRDRAPRPVELARPLAALPLTLDNWHGVEAGDLDASVKAVLGADEYLNRVYGDDRGAAVGLYVAYYGSQTQGDSIHSPQNCLPGNGWQPEHHTRSIVRVVGREFPVNQYVVRRRGERQLVLYWFQGRGRILASEYANKAFLLIDALREGRTDGALVRVVTPVGVSQRTAEQAALRFVSALQAELERWL
jgi:EpsI family protein